MRRMRCAFPGEAQSQRSSADAHQRTSVLLQNLRQTVHSGGHSAPSCKRRARGWSYLSVRDLRQDVQAAGASVGAQKGTQR